MLEFSLSLSLSLPLSRVCEMRLKTVRGRLWCRASREAPVGGRFAARHRAPLWCQPAFWTPQASQFSLTVHRRQRTRRLTAVARLQLFVGEVACRVESLRRCCPARSSLV